MLASGSQYVGLQFQYGIKFFYIFFIHYDVIASASLVFGLPPQFNAGPPVLLAHGFYLHAVRFTRISLLQYVRVAVGHSINDFACCTRLGVATTATCIVAGSQSLLLSALSSSSSWLPMLCCVRGFGGVISLPSQEEQLLPSKYISH